MGGYADEVSLKLTTRDEMSAKLRDARKELRTIEKEMATVRKEVTDTGSKEAAAQLEKLEKKWAEVNERQRDAAKGLSEARRALSKVGGEAKDTAKATENLTGASKRGSGALSKLSSRLVHAAAKATHLDKRLDAAEKSMSRSSGKWGKAGIAAGAAVAGGAAVAATAAFGAGKAIASMTKAAMEDEAGQARFHTAIKKTSKATDAQIASLEDWISAQGEATGYADDQLRPALQRLSDSFGSIGKSKDMAKLAMDIASGTGKDPVKVAEALAKANDGNVTSLKKLGITLGPQAKNMIEYQKASISLTSAQANAANALETYGPKSKQYAAAQAKVADKQKQVNSLAGDGIDIFGELGEKFAGQTSKKAKTLEGRVARLKLIFDETKESVGGAFIPILTDLAAGFQDKVLPVIRGMASKVMPKLRSAFDHFKGVVKENRPGLERMATIFGAIGKVLIEKVIPWIAKVQFKAWEGGVKLIAGFGDALFAIAPDFLRFAATAVDAFNSVHDAALTAFGGILHAADKALGWMDNGLGRRVRSAANGFDEFKAKSKAAMEKTAAGLRKAADEVEKWNAKAKKTEAAKVRGDIKDLRSKIAEGVKRLKDPKLTKPERSKLRADIADLRAKAAEAKRKLDMIPREKKVRISAHGTSLATNADKASKLLGVLNKLNGMNVHYSVSGGSGGFGGGDNSIVAPSRGGYTRPTAGGWSGNWFRYRSGKYHGGADLGRLGNPVVASSDQRVRYVRHMNSSYGNHVVTTNGKYDFLYAHMGSNIRVSANDFVGRGQRIGTVGWSGHVIPKSPMGAHLHYEVRPAGAGHGSALNPGRFMRDGGRIHGPGTGTSDSVPIMGSNGEFMIREAAARRIGYDRLEALNWADRIPDLPAPIVDIRTQSATAPAGTAPLVGTMVVNASSQIDFELGLAREARRQARERRTRYAEVS